MQQLFALHTPDINPLPNQLPIASIHPSHFPIAFPHELHLMFLSPTHAWPLPLTIPSHAPLITPHTYRIYFPSIITRCCHTHARGCTSSLMFGSRALQTEQGGCPGIPLCWVQGRGMHAAKQPWKFLCFLSLLMAGGKLTDWQPLQNQDAASPPRFSAAISSFPIHLGHTHARIQPHGFISHGHPPKPTAKAHLLRLLSCMHVAEAWSVQQRQLCLCKWKLGSGWSQSLMRSF